MNSPLPPEQDVDQLLRAYFQRQMPDPWPAFEPPARRTLPFRPAAPRRRFVLGSKLALAASVALLMVCGWLLSGAFDGPTGPKVPVDDTRGGVGRKDQGKHHDGPMPDDDRPTREEVGPMFPHRPWAGRGGVKRRAARPQPAGGDALHRRAEAAPLAFCPVALNPAQ